ncbi:MAG: DUF349 domain-containing protein [Bacteroidetes bacterium]|nr:DUF349 domain-containing protein [Bacteroidota bacterium]MDA1119325.1 DUF349 domain-containing protein [Bacteroidota bacterium]
MEKKRIPFGYILDNKIHLDGILNLPDRIIGEVKESEDDSLTYFTNRFDDVQSKVDQLESDIDSADNKGSYLMKLIHLREKLKKHDGLGDYASLFSKLDQLESGLQELVAVNRLKNAEIKTALLKEFEDFEQVKDWRVATEKILSIKERWLKTGAADKEKNEAFEKHFTSNLQNFFDRKKEYLDEKRKVIEIRLNKMRSLIDRAKKINPDDPQLNLKEEARQLKKEWFAIGLVPQRDKLFLEKDFNRKISQLSRNRNSQPRDPQTSSEDLEKNLIKKQELLRQALAIGNDETEGAFQQLKQLQLEWQQIGLIPQLHYKELTEQFKTICEKASEKRSLEQLAQNKDEHYAEKNNREKTRYRIVLLKDLLKRDEKDLQAFANNMDKFNRDQNFNKIMSNKLVDQKRKILVKRQILVELKNSLNDIIIQK